MSQREHYYFLLEIAGAIHTLTVSAKAKAKFAARMKKFVKMFLDWEATVDQARKDADADPRLRDPQTELSKEGYIWDTPEGLWRLKDCSPNPTAWFWNRNRSPEQRELTLDEILTCDYFRLAVIHDGISQGQRHIYFQCTEDVWTDDTGASGPIPTEAKGLWEEISEWGQDKETTWLPGLRVQIENALSDVEADLTKGQERTIRLTNEINQKVKNLQAGQKRIEVAVSKKVGLAASQISKPLSSAKWAVIFGVSQSTMRRWRVEKKYPFVQISPRKWALPINSLPTEYLHKYQQYT